MDVDQLTKILVGRHPDLPQEKLAFLAEAVIELCDEARAFEREACAKIADGEKWEREAMFSDIHVGQDMAARDIAAKIRARSTQHG